MATMQAAICRQAGRIVVEESPRPEPGPGDVVVRIRNCGICGSDLHWYHDHMMIPTVCPGHEIAGEVADVGLGVSALRAGDRVAVEGIESCGTCRYCAAGTYHLCPAVGIVGMTVPGGYAEYLRIPARHCFPVPKDVPFDVAALSEPLAVSVHGVRTSGLAIGQRVLVLGAGTIGLMAVLAARAGGAGEVLVTARRPQQKAAAAALGADHVLDERDGEATAQVIQAAPVDLVVETVGGDADTLDQAVFACRPGGTICVLGAYTKMPTFPALFVLAKELTIKGSFVYNRTGARADFEIVQDLLARHVAVLGRTVITHRVPLAAIDGGFRTASDKTTGSIKVTVQP